MRAAALALLALLATAPVLAGERLIAGEVFYLPRIALPETAELELTLAAPDGTLLARKRIPTAGRQVPLPFAIAAPADAPVVLGAAILGEEGGAPLWAAMPLPLAAGETDLALPPLPLERHQPLLFPVAMRCGERELRFSPEGEGALIALGARVIPLIAEEGTSGLRYRGRDDRAILFRSKGEEARLVLDGAEMLCHSIPALPSFPLLAIGQEPGWRLEVAEGRIRLEGAVAAEGAIATAELTEAGERYATADGALAVTLDRRLCRDAMTGMPHPFTVTVEAEGTTLPGCGGDPARLLEEGPWQVTELAGAPMPEGVEATLEFAEGRVSGLAGCNRFAGAVELTGEGLRFGPLDATRMACAEPWMEAEARLLAALEATTRFDIGPGGALLLFAGEAPLLLARR